MNCCQGCGVEAPTKYVEFYQNIGALVVRFSKSIKGNLCKNCINEHFWSMTAVTLFLGPWGVISLIVTPFFLLNNVGRYLFALSLEKPAPGARAPRLTDTDIQKLSPHTDELIKLLNANKPLDQVSPIIASKAGVTPGQVVLYVDALIRAARAK